MTHPKTTAKTGPMSHHEALSRLLAAAPLDATRTDAEAHVARCWRCFEVLATLRALASGDHADTAAARAAYGCDAVEEQLHDLVGLTAGDLRERAPGVASHLGWCTACRALLVALAAVEDDAAAGAYGDPITTVEPAWSAIGAHAGRRVWQLAETVVVRLADGLVRVAAAPRGVWLEPLDAGAAMRGVAEPVRGVRLRARCPGGRPDLEVIITPTSARRATVETRDVSGAGFDAATLRLVRDASEELIGSMPADRTFAAVFRDVPAGRYVLGVVDRAAELRLPLSLVGTT
jgi:hypothetical protein